VTQGLRAVVVTGLSGSGKSTALKVLEDLGFYCIDNLPVALLPKFIELWQSAREDVSRVALGIDVRERRFLRDFPHVFDELRAAGAEPEVIYLDASDDVLVRRFSETRRPHPAAEGGTVADGIRREREALRELRALATRIVDTSAFTVHELRAALRELLATPDAATMTISLVSFGYKHGLPTDADLALDCRFLPNPFFVEELRPKTGLEPDVAAYVLERPDAQEFLTHVLALLAFTLPRYQREGKSYLTIAIGCTGGRHRSVVLVEEFRRRLAALGHRVLVRHRDLER
jgi:RNase adapter protein RapZ